MSTYNHTAITTGAAALAGTFNNPLGELDAAIGDLSTLTTTEKSSAVGAINEAINEALENLLDLFSTNRHLSLDGTDETVLTSDYYLQVDGLTADTDIILPAISDYGVGRELSLQVALLSSYTITLVPDSVDGDAVIGGTTITPTFKGIFIFRTVASYPGETGACWVLMIPGESIV